MSCGSCHTAIITEDEELFMMGRGREGQLGRQMKDQSNSGYSLIPKRVSQLPNGSFWKAVCGFAHTFILLKTM